MPAVPPTPPVTPNADEANAASVAVAQIEHYLNHHPSKHSVRLVVEDGDNVVVPRQAVEMLASVLVHMAAAEGVSVVPHNAELTTQQAADMLNVSRPYLIKLLEAGEIDYRLVGKHRRISFANLRAYQRADDQRRRTAADELSALTQELGLA